MEKIRHTTVSTNGINIHVATTGDENTTNLPILFLHGFPELWYSWRHQLISLSSLGYRCIAPDMRGYGDSDSPPSATEYTAFHIVGDLVGLLDALGIEKVFLVGHDWGALIAWSFCMFRGDRIVGLVNTSVPLTPRNPKVDPVEMLRSLFGDDYYLCRFQEPGEAEEDFAQVETQKLMKKLLSYRDPKPPCIPKEIGFKSLPDPTVLPSWLTEDDIKYYASKFQKTGFTGGLNYYRAMKLTWELMAAWTGYKIQVPVKFIVGDMDMVYHIPGTKEFLLDGGLKEFVPNLEEVVVLEGVAHFLNQEQPELISQHILDFVKKF